MKYHLTMFVKFMVTKTVIFCYRNKPHIFKAIALNYKLLLLYFIPSLLYCFYNNLAFINLQHYDPTSYYILLQFRVVLTALLFQVRYDNKYINKTFKLIFKACIIYKHYFVFSFYSKRNSHSYNGYHLQFSLLGV